MPLWKTSSHTLKKLVQNNVTQICLDNASALLGVLDELVALYPHMYKQGCYVHIIGLLLEDLGKEIMFKTLLTKDKQVCIHIQNYHATMTFFCHYSPKTSFACNFLKIGHMLEFKDALE